MPKSRKSGWNLYWISYDGDDEDCFVVAKNSRSARCFDANYCGYDACDATATHAAHISRSLLSTAKARQAKARCKIKWPTHADDWLLKKLGAQFRSFSGMNETLLDGVVYTHNFKHSVPPRAIGRKYLELITSDPRYTLYDEEVFTPSQMTLFGILGICLARCQEIEHIVANSFVLGLNERDRNRYKTVSMMREAWEKKTFGQMLNTIKEAWRMDSGLEMHLNLFKELRNKLVHGLTMSKRYDITSSWGQDECFAFLVHFEYISRAVRVAFRSAFYASCHLALHLNPVPDKKSPLKLTRKQKYEAVLFHHLFRPIEEIS